MIERELDDLPAIVAQFGKDALKIIDKYMERALVKLRSVVAEYPVRPLSTVSSAGGTRYLTRTDVYGRPFESDKQRRWFFAALKSGEINVPYKRRGMRGGLRAHWATAVRNTPGAVTGYIGNSSPYYKYVQGDEQSRYHEAQGWKTMDRAMTISEPDIIQMWKGPMMTELKDLWGANDN